MVRFNDKTQISELASNDILPMTDISDSFEDKKVTVNQLSKFTVDNISTLSDGKTLTANDLTNNLKANYDIAYSNTLAGIAPYSATVTYNKPAIVQVADSKGKPVLYYTLQDNNIGHDPTEADSEWWVELKTGGSGLELCDIGTALYIDETKGLRRYLNGQIVDINANTQAFLNRLLQIQTTNPEYFTTEENWQAESLLGIDGCVYKFVLNYSGDNVVSVRLPKYPDYVEINAGGTLPVVGNGMSLGLTINGTDTFYAVSGLDWNGSDPNYNSVMKWSSIDGVLPSHGTQTSRGANNTSLVGITNDSTKSGIQTTLKQTKLKMRYFIQIATGSETEVNIKDTLELNNPFTFGMNMYFKGEMENISWLKSAGQQNAKALCPDFYNWVLANANTGKDGFKLSTASDITDYDFEVNTTDETFRLPLKNGLEGVFVNGVKGTGSPIGLTDGNSDKSMAASTTIGLTSSDNLSSNVGTLPSGLPFGQVTVGLTTDPSKSGMVVDTTVPVGYNLYYYVGVVIKNEGLINAGRIGENLANKLDTPPRYPVEISDKSLMPSWYVVYNDGWCEQGGISKTATTGVATVSLLKPYESINYTRLLTLGDRLDSTQWAIYPTNKTTTSFGAFSPTTGYELVFDWETKGYIS